MSHVLLFDRAGRGRIRFTGAAAVPTLNGLVTNDVAALEPGRGQYAAMLTAKGKIVADVRIVRRADDVLVDAAPRAAAGMRDMIKKFVNPRFAAYEDVSDQAATFTVTGLGADVVAAAAAGVPVADVAALPPFGHLTGAEGVLVLRTPEIGLPAYDLVVPSADRERVWGAALAAGARVAGEAEWEGLRVAAGWPAWGIDMTDATLPQEANFDELQGVSYTKGCYIGQEPVARIHFRGHVNRTLRRLAFADPAPPAGAALWTAESEVGDVRSVARTAEGAAVGIGMVRREVAGDAALVARWTDAAGAEMTTGVSVVGKAKGAIE